MLGFFLACRLKRLRSLVMPEPIVRYCFICVLQAGSEAATASAVHVRLLWAQAVEEHAYEAVVEPVGASVCLRTISFRMRSVFMSLFVERSQESIWDFLAEVEESLDKSEAELEAVFHKSVSVTGPGKEKRGSA